LNRERITDFRYADDTAVFADSLVGLQDLMNRINGASDQYDIKGHPKLSIVYQREPRKKGVQIHLFGNDN